MIESWWFTVYVPIKKGNPSVTIGRYREQLIGHPVLFHSFWKKRIFLSFNDGCFAVFHFP